jgi:hypothetical protein
MEEDIPQPLKTAAILQIVSGLVNWFVMSWIAWMSIGCVCGALTFIVGGLGAMCGIGGLLLIPIGWIEIGAGVYGLMNPKEGAKIMKYVTYVEMGSVLLGGIPAAIIGFVVTGMLGNDEVVAYLEG